MGNVFSGKKKELTPEEQQRRLQQEHGVLIPPVFTVSHGDGYFRDLSSMPTSTQTQRIATMNSPNLVDYLWRLNTGHNLLTEYMTPGLYLGGE
jgi:hypothetical protein